MTCRWVAVGWKQVFTLGSVALMLYVGNPFTNLHESDVSTASCRCDIQSADEVIILPTSELQEKRAWLNERLNLLANATAKKVLFFSYMRGGSTVGGELFNQNSAALLWYEPGDAFFMSYYGISEENLPQHDLYFRNGTLRPLSEDEQNALIDFFHSQLSCDYERLPVESLAHHFHFLSRSFADFTGCLGNHIRKGSVLTRCVRYVAPACGNTVESAAAEKCHVLVRYAGEVLRSNRNRIRPTSEDGDHLDGLLQAKFRAKLQASGQEFDPRLYSKLDWFLSHRLCLESVRDHVRPCLIHLIRRCAGARLRVLEVNRMHMADAEALVERIPDLHVFYYVRDPRAIAVSRCKSRHLVSDIADIRPVKEARLVCLKMASDLNHFRSLNASYPGAFELIKYEDLIRDPEGVAKFVYGVLGEPYPDQWTTFARHSIHSEDKDRWRRHLSKAELDQINSYCGRLVKALGYDL